MSIGHSNTLIARLGLLLLTLILMVNWGLGDQPGRDRHAAGPDHER
jgi:hypothetical protein